MLGERWNCVDMCDRLCAGKEGELCVLYIPEFDVCRVQGVVDVICMEVSYEMA